MLKFLTLHISISDDFIARKTVTKREKIKFTKNLGFITRYLKHNNIDK